MPEITRNGQSIELTHPDKILFPDPDISKKEFVEYYDRIAEIMLPHIKDRPLSMHRFTSGIEGEGFFHKEAPSYFPEWITRTKVKLKEDGEQEQVVCNTRATLIYIANQDCITPHIWLSRMKDLENPDRMIFDFDPPDDDFDIVRSAAQEMRSVLEEETGVKTFVMTTGSRGIHVVVALQPEHAFDEVRKFAHAIAQIVVNRNPEQFTIEQRKEKRGNRVFIDYLRNAYAQTTVAPYAVRAKKEAPIATPIDWDEIGDSDLTSRRYNIKNIFRRLSRKEDPWKDINRHKYSINEPMKKLRDILKDIDNKESD